MMRRFKLLLPLLVLVLFALFVIWFRSTEEPTTSTATFPASQSQAVARAVVSEFREWNQQHRDKHIAPAELEKGIELAAARKQVMAEWIATDPEQALANSVSRSEYAALPEELKPYFEVPFNTVGNLRILPVCSPGANSEPMRTLEIEGKSWAASVFGWRKGQDTKETTPLAGITLGDRAAISTAIFEILTPADAKTVANLPIGNRDARRDFATGKPLGEHPVTAIAGPGPKRYLFNSPASVRILNEKLAELDQTPGPHGGSIRVFAMGEGGDSSEGISYASLEEAARVEASAWTETPKSVFFIRVDFSDQAGETVTQAGLSQVMNTEVADCIEQMSYNKTTINATVSATTVRMPSPKGTYLPSNNDLLYDDAVAAYKAIAGASSLDGYNIVGVHFPSIGITSSGGVQYAGLAGGTRQWLQGTSSSGVIIHEFGHNYGLGHSSSWDTTDGSVVGAGSSTEYGDPFDIMGGGPDPEGHFHMQGKQRLNWLTAAQWTDATATGSATYRVYRFDDLATTQARRGVRVTKAAAATETDAEHYWFGYRPGIPGNPWLDNGAYLVWKKPGQTRSWLLDTTPNSASGRKDAALAIGRTYSDTTANVHITPTATGGVGADAWLDVNVQLGPFPTNNPPTATLTAPATAAARTNVNFSVSASDPNGNPMAYYWDFGDSSISTNSAAVTHSWTVGGTYTVSVTVTDMKGGTVTKTQQVVVSDPLNTWTAGTVVAGRTMSKVEYFDGRFVAGGNQYAYLSFDGITWREQYLGLNYGIGGFASDGNKFVAAGYDHNGAWYGKIHHSTDGLIWQSASMPTTEELRDVVAGNGIFVAVGDSGTILRSSDGGATWTTQTAPGTASLSGIAYGGGVFVAVGGTTVYTSPDGISWTDRSAGTGLESWHSFKDVVFTNGSFITGGWYSGLRKSTDGGITWQTTTIVGGADYNIKSLAVGGGAIVATAGRRPDPEVPVLLVSQNGDIWEQSKVASFPSTSTATFGDGVYMTVHGSSGASSQSGTFYPTNTAPTASITAPSTGNARQSVSFSANASDANGNPLTLIWDFKDGTALREGTSVSHTFPVGGTYSVDLIATDSLGGVTTTSHSITITDPLNTWTQRTSGTTAQLNDIAFGGGKLVAVGSGKGTYRVSTDGTTWTGGIIWVSGNTANNLTLNGIIYSGAQFVAVGEDYDFNTSSWTGAIYTSPNGTTWTRQNFSGGGLYDVAYGGGHYVAVGAAGTIWHSTNGTVWSPISSGVTTKRLSSVAYGNGGFVAGGFNTSNSTEVVTLTSTDGTTWDNTTPGAGFSWMGFSELDFCNNRFLASGWNTKIRQSTDGGVTFVDATATTNDDRFNGFAYGNGIYLAAGVDQNDTAADINLISMNGTTWSRLTTTTQNNRNAAIFFNNTFITVGDGGSIWQSNTFTGPTGYAVWHAQKFPEIPPGSETNDDYDSDGIPNLGEYLTGTDPRNRGDRAPFTTTVTGGYLTITIPKAAGITDATMQVEGSTNLQTWSAVDTTVITNNASTLTVKLTAPVNSANPRGFLRVVFNLVE